VRMLLRFVMGLAAANESERTGESDELGWELVSTTGAGRSARTPMRRSTAGDGVGDAGAPIRSGDAASTWWFRRAASWPSPCPLTGPCAAVPPAAVS
jgi:hypothetical protein